MIQGLLTRHWESVLMQEGKLACKALLPSSSRCFINSAGYFVSLNPPIWITQLMRILTEVLVQILPGNMGGRISREGR